MERKTMGAFIAALRKANGMTQRDLAEKLNVSDKSVSRWERDDGAPDLSLIPVIAEIFGVTCDELLRGERSQTASQPSETEPTPRAEKQIQRMLTVRLARFKNQTLIALGVALVGLIAAMIANFGFLRAYIGFLVGCIFYLASGICQAIFLNGAFLSVADDGLSGEVAGFKNTAIRLSEVSMGINLVLLGASLPLVLLPYDGYMGLTFGSWFTSALATGGMTVLLVAVILYFLNAHLIRKDLLSVKNAQRYWHNHGLQRKCALLLAGMLAVTGIFQFAANLIWDDRALADSIRFDDFDSFKSYMEQDIPYATVSEYTARGMVVFVETRAEPVDTHTYYDESGNEITEEEWYTQTLTDSEGNVLCTYQDRNQMVSVIQHDGDDGLPVTVITFDGLAAGRARRTLINAAFVLVYCLETAAVLLIYGKKRVRKS